MRNILLNFKSIFISLFIIFIHLISTDIINNDNVFINIESAKDYPGFSYQGEFVGQLNLNNEGRINMGLQIVSYGNNEFRALLYKGGLPGESTTISDDEVFELVGTFNQHNLVLEGEFTLIFKYNEGRMTLFDQERNSVGYIKKVFRRSPTLGMESPENAIVLFDGSNLNYFASDAQMDENGLLVQGARTVKNYGDKRLHIEAKLGFMPDHRDGNRANSGIYIQNRYEVQILDSFARPALINGNAALYNEVAPKVNISYPPLTWQTYDIYFRAPRFNDDGYKTENARFTVYLNGVLVHDNVELESGTGAGGNREEVAKAELYLQDHGDPVRFRNIWIVEGETSPPAAGRLNLSVD